MPAVLIVDDSLTIRMNLAEIFRLASFRVTTCASLYEAKRALEHNDFDLLILDILLPDGDGVTFLGELRSLERTSQVPVMMLSSEAEVRDRIRGMQGGANEFVGKPYDEKYVLSRAKSLITGPQEERKQPMVLFIDDSLTYREHLRSEMEQAGYTVVTAVSGEEGLLLAAELLPNVIVVDGYLPGIDGATVIRQIRLDAVLRRIPCILLTAADGDGEEVRALDSGADDFVGKESSALTILARIHAQIRSRGVPVPGISNSLVAPKRILAVDDSLTFRNQLAEQLRRDGFEPVLAASGSEALALLAVQSVDCILLDLTMPGLSGQETCRSIKSAPGLRDIPLLILTADEQHHSLVMGFEAGADDYILKSGNFEIIKARMRAQLRRKQFEDENRQLREERLLHEMEVAETKAALELAETRKFFLADLEAKNHALAVVNSEMQQAHESLKLVQQQKAEWISFVVHDLKNPLTSISLNAHYIRSNPNTTVEISECADDLINCALAMHSMVLNVLDISRSEEGTLVLHPETIEVAGLFQDTQRHFLRALAERGLRAEIKVHPAIHTFTADRDIVQRVLHNVFDNAIKNSPSGSVIRLHVESKHDSSIVIKISDEGIGIPAALQHDVFDKYVQLPDYGNPKDGHGLGLTFCRVATEAHGGRIWVEPNEPSGCIFCIELPKMSV